MLETQPNSMMHRQRFRLRKCDRMRKRSEFLRLSAEGRRKENRVFIMIFGPGAANRPRLGITVTKRIGSAVTRNRIKRLSREFYRKNRHRIRGAWDINLIAKRAAGEFDTERIFDSLEELFGRLTAECGVAENNTR